MSFSNEAFSDTAFGEGFDLITPPVDVNPWTVQPDSTDSWSSQANNAGIWTIQPDSTDVWT